MALSGKLSQTSTIFYFGVEGMGGLEMETEEDENVRRALNPSRTLLNVTLGYRRGH
jgi:hypothetical protein